MNKRYLTNILLFLICSVIVIFLQLILLRPIISYQSLNLQDDWMMLFRYKELSFMPLLNKLIFIWTKNGLHDSAAILHIGFLNSIFGDNYQAYQNTNVFLKILSALTIFPLVLVIFKNRFLAFLTTIFYAINSGTAGSFYWIMKGGYYSAITLMNIFLISYYYTVIKKSKLLLILSTVLLLFSYLLAPPRVFPIFMIIIFAEIFWLFKKGFTNIKFSILRLVCFISPVVIIASRVPVSPCCPITQRPSWLLNDILNGNLHNLLSPFSGLGFSFLTNDFWRFFGPLTNYTFLDFWNYLAFLAKGPLIIFVALTIILSLIISGTPKKFFLLTFSLNLLFEVVMFFIASHHFYIAKGLIMPYDPGLFLLNKYSALMGIYILVVAFVSFLEWKRNKDSTLLLSIWVGPMFAFTFLFLMWTILGYLIDAYSSTQYYFLIPPMGTALFISSILVLMYRKFQKYAFSKSIASLFILLVIFAFFYWSDLEITRGFLPANNLERVTIKDQQVLLKRIIEAVGKKGGNLLLYLELPQNRYDIHTGNYYRQALVLDNFAGMMFSRGELNNIGCVAAITDKQTLLSSVNFTNNKVGFLYNSQCLNKGRGGAARDVFYNTDDFRAFRVENGEFIDIKEDILRMLNK